MTGRELAIQLGRAKEPDQPTKAPRQLRNCGLVFEDPYHISRLEREVQGEARWQTIGMVNGIYAILVVPTSEFHHEEEEHIRIISARKATPQERHAYAQGE
ncbi:MAG TPA: BrnT family toxin [Bryocella sp.]|nr:BrnT family toxin [Bryocella sp.]